MVLDEAKKIFNLNINEIVVACHEFLVLDLKHKIKSGLGEKRVKKIQQLNKRKLLTVYKTGKIYDL